MNEEKEMLGDEPSIQHTTDGSNIEQNSKKVNEFNSYYLDQAIKYHKRNWSIIPIHEVKNGTCTCNSKDCTNPGKHPRVKWKEYQDRLPTEEEIYKWWTKWPNSNIGLVTGKVSGAIALDIDKRSKGEDTIREMVLTIPTTLTNKTGGGGWHYIFRHPQFDCRNFAGKRGETVLQGIDFRGDGGFIVLPPSTHSSGNSYSWVDESTDIAEAPDWLLRLIQEQAIDVEYNLTTKTTSPLGGFKEGKRDNELYRYACRLRSKGISKEEAGLLVCKAAANCSPPFSEQEALKKVENVYKTMVKEKYIGEAPKITTAIELEEMELPPTKWILDGILPEGFTLLAGRAKSGKSFLALQLAISTALGKDINGFGKLSDEVPIEELPFGEIPFVNKPRDVLYIDLEMDERSVRDRMRTGISKLDVIETSRNADGGIHFKICLVETPGNLYFSFSWPRIGSGFEEHLNDFLDGHPDVALVVVDVFKCVRPKTKGKDGSTLYEKDYDDLTPLQTLAKERGIAILVLHHTRKKMGIDNDPVEMVSGSMGMTAAPDSIYTLERHSDNTATLHITGRKFESQSIKMELGAGGIWEVIGKDDGVRMSEARKEVIDLLTSAKRPMKIKEIADALGKNYSSEKKLLWQMAKDVLIVKENEAYLLSKKV